MREIIRSKKFKRDYRKIAASGHHSTKNDFLSVIELLAKDKSLPAKYCDHTLSGEWVGYKECHIKPDLLLIYTKSNSSNELILVRMGSHSELFS